MNKDLKQGSGVKSEISPADGKPLVSRCVKCKHFIVRPHRDWGESYTCAKNWYGGCSEPSGYGIRLCAEAKDFELKKDENQLELFP